MDFGQKFSIKLIYLISRVFLVRTFIIFMAHYECESQIYFSKKKIIIRFTTYPQMLFDFWKRAIAP